MNHGKGHNGGECQAEPSKMSSNRHTNTHLAEQGLTRSSQTTHNKHRTARRTPTQEEPQEHTHNTTPKQHARDSKEYPDAAKQAQNGKENPNAAKHAQQEEPPVSTRCSNNSGATNGTAHLPIHHKANIPSIPSTLAFTRPGGKQPQRQGHSTPLCSQSAVANNNLACFTAHLHHH